MLPKRRKPTHPGQILVEEFLKPLNITPRQLADKLGKPWTEFELNKVLLGKEYLSDHLAAQLAQIFEPPAHFWIHLQSIYKEWEAIHKQNEHGSSKPWKKASSY